MADFFATSIYTGLDGSTTLFSVPFPALDLAHIMFYRLTPGQEIGDDTPPAVLGTDYEWTSPGIAHFFTGPVGVLVIRRETPGVTNLDRLVGPGTIGSRVLNTNLVQLLYLFQEGVDRSLLSELRAVRAPLGDSLTELPPAAERAGQFLTWDSSGNPVLGSAPVSTSAIADALSTTALTSIFNRTSFGYGTPLPPGFSDPVADTSIINTSGFWLNRASAAGQQVFTGNAQLTLLPSGDHNRSYEAGAWHNTLVHYDSSRYSNRGSGNSNDPAVVTSTRDGVAADGSWLIPGGLNIDARAWGINMLGRIGTLAAHNGTVRAGATMMELALDNWGEDAGHFYDAGNINIACLFPGGNKMATAHLFGGLRGTPGQAGSEYGFAMQAEAVREWGFSLWELRNGPYNIRWGVRPSGAMEMKGFAGDAYPAGNRVRIQFDTIGNLKALFGDGSQRIITSNVITAQSKSANVVEITGWDKTDSKDMTAAFQALINAAASVGVPVECPKGVIRLTSPIVIPPGSVFRGSGKGDYQTTPDQATTFHLDHTGQGFIFNAGLGAAGFWWSGFDTLRNQPPVVSGQPWSPNDHDYDFYMPNAYGCTLEHFNTRNATRGIYYNGGRHHITDWGGQCYKRGLSVDWAYDTCYHRDFHQWPFQTVAPEVSLYMRNNLWAIDLKRLDNSFFTDCFSIAHQYAFHIGYWTNPTSNPNTPAGTCSKLDIKGADWDIGTTGYCVAPEADGHTAEWSNVKCQGRDDHVGAPQLLVQGPNTEIIGFLKANEVGGNVIRVEATAPGSNIQLFVKADSYNLSAQGFPGVEVIPKSNPADTRPEAVVELLPGSFLNSTRAGGAAKTSGNVITWKSA